MKTIAAQPQRPNTMPPVNCRSLGATLPPTHASPQSPRRAYTVLTLPPPPKPTHGGYPNATTTPAAQAASPSPQAQEEARRGSTTPCGVLFPSGELDNQETPSHDAQVVDVITDYDPPPPQWEGQTISRAETAWRHSGWAPTRRLIWQALKARGTRSVSMARFANCGASATVEWSPSLRRYRVRGSFCHHRFCQPCAAGRANTIAVNVATRTKGVLCRFLTLTLRHNASRLRDQLARLYDCYAKLRRNNLWTTHVTAALAFLEVKRSKDGHRWHPHLHVLIASRWMPEKDLAERWYAITGDSYIVDVRAITGAEEVIAYVTKYATKPLDPQAIRNPQALDELIGAVKGRRMYIVSGDWSKLDLNAKPADPGDWQVLGSLDDFAADCQRDNPSALALLDVLRPQFHQDAPRPASTGPPARFTAALPCLWQEPATPQPTC